jgi:N-acetylglucosaminyldiphosphoundecaprenol N-acetyl-beta-D-mannosaminyltransferase
MNKRPIAMSATLTPELNTENKQAISSETPSPARITDFQWQSGPLSPSYVETVQSTIEDIPVDIFPTLDSMFDRIVSDCRAGWLQNFPKQIYSINIHGANMAHRYKRFKKLMQQADTMICDGAGIMVASKMAATQTIPSRYCAGDYLPALMKRLADEKLTVYFLAGEPGVADQAVENLSRALPNHTIVGHHHGYILKDKVLENKVIDEINALKPDLLFVGFGMPLQEYWMEENIKRLKVGAILPFGATLDYISQKVPRCPVWLGNLGLEWLFRFCLEPNRMFSRYIQGNPEFMLRILKGRLSGV